MTASQQQQSRINTVLYAIHSDISASLSARSLAKVAAYSEQHFHRVFKRVVGESVNVYIRRTRLEHAANQLMFDRNSSILNIAEKCGFNSLSSFIKAFTRRYSLTPGQWRAVDGVQSAPPYLEDAEIALGYQRIETGELPKATIVSLKTQMVAYVRHKGYGRSIAQAWQTLLAWAAVQGLGSDDGESEMPFPLGAQIGLHHSNPAYVPLDDCHYVACMSIESHILRRGLVNSLVIPGGLHAKFDLTGRYGDLLPYLSKILENWLPSSGYTLQTTPAFVHYRKNQFLEPDDRFDVSLYLPISLA